MKLILKGEPKSTNNIYKIACRGTFPRIYMSRAGKALKEDYGYQARSQWHCDPLVEGFKLRVKLFFKTKRVHDVDNYNKILYDALSGIIWEDDVQIQEVTTSKHYDKENPRIELTIKKIAD